jgi:hypothetical protein
VETIVLERSLIALLDAESKNFPSNPVSVLQTFHEFHEVLVPNRGMKSFAMAACGANFA